MSLSHANNAAQVYTPIRSAAAAANLQQGGYLCRTFRKTSVKPPDLGCLPLIAPA
jgi:hypothetical protein